MNKITKIIEDVRPRDIVAIIALSGMIILRLAGKNGALDPIVSLIIGYYFAKKEEHPIVVRHESLVKE